MTTNFNVVTFAAWGRSVPLPSNILVVYKVTVALKFLVSVAF